MLNRSEQQWRAAASTMRVWHCPQLWTWQEQTFACDTLMMMMMMMINGY